MSKGMSAEDQVRFKDLIRAYKEVFLSHKDGRKVLDDILSRTGVFRTTFTGNSKTFFLEGARSVGLQILEMLEIAEYGGLEHIRNVEDNEHE